MQVALLLLLTLSLAASPDPGQRPDTTKAQRRPPSGQTAGKPSADRGKPQGGAKPTGEPQLKRRKPPGGQAG
jgi:hypothetical protein